MAKAWRPTVMSLYGYLKYKSMYLANLEGGHQNFDRYQVNSSNGIIQMFHCINRVLSSFQNISISISLT